VVFHTSQGAVVVVIDPASAFGGSVLIPGLGTIPYDLDWATQSMILRVPGYGNVVIPLLGGGGDGTIDIPGMGAIPYQVTIGEPDIPYEQRVTGVSAAFGLGVTAMMPWLLIGGAVLLMLFRRR
jgi:hypothetical protein